MSESASIDQVLNYWNSRPCNIKHSNAEIGSIKYFNEVEERKYFVEPHIPGFAEFAKWNGKKVLEIGCGIGTDAVNFVRNGAIYTGIELSTESLKLAKRRFDVFNLEGNLMEGDAETIHEVFENSTFDLIYSFGVLHHTPDFSRALNSIRKICSSGTLFKFMVYAQDSWKNAMINSGLDQPEAQSGCPIANVYSKKQLAKILENAGFEVLSIRQDHIFPYKVKEYLNYEYIYEDWFAAMPSQMFKALEAQLGWHLLVEARPKIS